MNPDCHSGVALEVHHIQPLKMGGKDEYSNLIILCFDCHRRTKLHGKWAIKRIELLTAKFYMESKILGFTSDCEDLEFIKMCNDKKSRNPLRTNTDLFI